MTEQQELQEQEPGVGEGVSEEVTQETAEPTAAATEQRQPEQESTPSKVNLDDLDEFREWKSSQDKRMAEMERRYQQQLAQYQQQLEEVQTADMDDYQRMEHERKKLAQQNQYLMTQLQEQQAEAAKHQALNEVAQTMGVPMDALMEAQDLNDAWKRAATYQRQQEQRRIAEQQQAAQAKAAAKADRQQRNSVDTGSGTPLPTNDWERQYNQLRQKKDAWGMFTHALGNSQRDK